jgi:2-dehydro-3-deoxyphosphogluconate aldolase/(4S)-4-hydroxy-2-oxoglutarate aldolase
MYNKEEALAELQKQKLLPLYYHEDAEKSITLLKLLYEAGIRMVEYTNRGEAALENFRQMRKLADKKLPGLLLGIGTIKTRKQAKKFMEAGADFVVCPIVDEDTGEAVSEAGLLWIPGCMTPSEIARAERAGAGVVKIFPGNILGPGYIASIRELFPDMKFMPTGGVEAEAENLKSWFRTGVIAVGLGSKLMDAQSIEREDYETLKKKITDTLQLVREASVI